jgi:hypothetical protein
LRQESHDLAYHPDESQVTVHFLEEAIMSVQVMSLLSNEIRCRDARCDNTELA